MEKNIWQMYRFESIKKYKCTNRGRVSLIRYLEIFTNSIKGLWLDLQL